MKSVLNLTAGLVILAVLAAPTAQAAAPSLGGVTPRGAQRGKEVELTFSGGRLEDAQEVMFYEPGIEVTKFTVVNGGAIKVTAKIAPDCRLGNHRLRVRTASGISDLRVFIVGNLTEVVEKEPNSDFEKPQPIAMNVTVNGVAQNEDVDYYIVEAKKGDRITAEVEAIRLGITFFDAYVAIMSAARFELSAGDDSALVFQDSIASIVAPEDGKYIVQVRESSYGGNGNCLYRLHVGNFPRPLATVPAGGKLGDKLDVKYLGDVAGEVTQSIQLPTQATPDFGLFLKDQLGVAPSQNYFRLSEFGNVIEAEPNETADTATKFTAPLALNGVLNKPGDMDMFRFTAKKGQAFDVRIHARSIRSPLDPVLLISYADGRGISSNDDSGGPDSYVRFGVPADGDYLIRITDHLGQGGPEYAYRVELTPIKPTLSLTVAEFRRYVQPTVSVPRGNRFALMINAGRRDFGGPLQIRAEDLPKGVTVECPGMPANLSSVPVIFTAAPDADVAGALAKIIGSLQDPKRKVEGHLTQTVTLVRGRNQIPVRSETVDRLAVAVTNEIPYTIELVQPKVPVVRGGSMNLKVVAKRKEGFTAAIKVDMLWRPPGIGASGSISIPAGKNEALIPINAAGNAQINEWSIAIRAQATVGNGAIMVSSQFAKLRIASQYVTFGFQAAAVEQGQETEMVVKVAKQVDFVGDAQVTLIGLPARVTTTPLKINKDTKELVFPIKTDKGSPAGNHKNLFCQVIIMENGEPVLHNLGGGVLRVDKPLPPKKNAPPKPKTVAKKPVAVKKPTVKRLTRLEKLRLEQEERRKEAKAAAATKQ